MTLNEELDIHAGRPAFYKEPEELQAAIDEYFDKFVYNDVGEVIGRKPTIAGMALALGFASRQSVYDYAEHGKYSYIIKKALLYFEDYHESSLSNASTSGHIFWLKNHGWKDKSEVDSIVNIKQALVEFSDGTNQSNDTNEV